MKRFEIFPNTKLAYDSMIGDIENSKKSVYIETYIYGNDEVGKRFREALIKKAIHGIKVLILIDAWGAKKGNLDKEFFSKLTEAGGEVRFFKNLSSYLYKLTGQNHEIDHRKLLLIDGDITYTGSANITHECLNWRELVIKLEGEITLDFTKSFLNQWNRCEKISKKIIKKIIYEGFEIILDVPEPGYTPIENKYVKLIKKSKKEILIETPYFVPPIKIRKELYKAVKRGVKVKIIMPQFSDHKVINIIKNRYLGTLYRHGIELYDYTSSMIHSKLLLVDDKFFLLGSSNLDYRSFIHQYEINLFGKDQKMIAELKKFFNHDLGKCKPFDYNFWKKRSSIKKIFEMLVSIVERYL